GMVGVFFFLTQFFQLVQGRSALVAGLALTPVAATMMMGAGIATKAVPKLGPKMAIVIAGLIILSGMGVFSTIEVDTSMWVPMLAIALFGPGAGIGLGGPAYLVQAVWCRGAHLHYWRTDFGKLN
ncbi:MAG: hypothetical protein O3C10_10000, partial [Chloroflexi bacterium]|nr:hypothetical protein [Chloroflexota bacterium]